MNARRILIALTVAGGSLVLAATAAQATGPKVPSGCSFDQAVGVLTCTNSVTTLNQLGPETSNGQWVPATAAFDGVSGAQICNSVFGSIMSGTPRAILLNGSTFLDMSVTVVTTTQRNGLNGRVFSSSSSTSSSLAQIEAGSMSCAWN